MSEGFGDVSAPELLSIQHDLERFSCGQPALDDWLRRRGLKNQKIGLSRTYAACVGQQVVGYYALAVGAIRRDLAIGPLRRSAPTEIPVMLLARLAVDERWHGYGIGRALLRDAAARTLQAAEIAGIRAMLVHALTDEAKRFYQYFGFRESRVEKMTLMVTLQELEAVVA